MKASKGPIHQKPSPKERRQCSLVERRVILLLMPVILCLYIELKAATYLNPGYTSYLLELYSDDAANRSINDREPHQTIISRTCESGESAFPPSFPSARNSTPIPLFYDKEAPWERDYIPWLIGESVTNLIQVDWKSDRTKVTVAKVSQETGGRYIALVGVTVGFTKRVMNIFRANPPMIVIHTGDETLESNKKFGSQLRELQIIGVQVLRQYNDYESFYHLENSTVKPVWVIPLGFMEGLQNKEQILWKGQLLSEFAATPTSRRTNVWTFIGNRGKSDRREMLRSFADLVPKGVVGRSHKNNIVSEYSKAKFVVNGRGWSNLNCFRVYEAVMNGAIPVVMGDNVEGSQSYYLGPWGNNRTVNTSALPWVITNTWPEAHDKVKRLLEHPDEIDKMQQRMFRWWNSTLCALRAQIYKVINSE